MKLNSADQKYSNLNENSPGVLNHRSEMTKETINDLEISGKCPILWREQKKV